MNVVALRGRLARPTDQRTLPSGDRLVSYEVTVDGPAGKAETVAVVWFGAPSTATGLDVDAPVVVVGRVRRRLFRSGGATQSRTEVVADIVLPSGHTKRVAAALRTVAAALEAADDGSHRPARRPELSVPGAGR